VLLRISSRAAARHSCRWVGPVAPLATSELGAIYRGQSGSGGHWPAWPARDLHSALCFGGARVLTWLARGGRLKPKKGKKAALQGGADEDDGESPEQHADEAQPVDPVRRRIGTARATPEAIRHAQDVAASHVRRSRASASTSQDNIVMARQPPAPLAFRAKY
jgi:hypothetical protein